MIFPPFVPTLQDIYSADVASNSSTPESSSEISDQIAGIGFPQAMQLTWMHSTSTMALFISGQDSLALYAACMPRGWQGPTYLYPGSSFVGDPMSSGTWAGDRFIFQLPGVPSYDISAQEITMAYQRSRSNPRYNFSMRVENEGSRRTESFEWRHSTAAQSSAYGMVWELVSLGRTSKSSSRHRNSDRSEIVAIIYEENLSSMSPSMQRVGGFQFAGRAVTTYMGYHWTLMALMSGIAVLQHATAWFSPIIHVWYSLRDRLFPIPNLDQHAAGTFARVFADIEPKLHTTPRRRDAWYLSTLAIHPSLQGNGLGSMLLTAGLERVDKAGVAAWLIGLEGIDNFYERYGFVTVEKANVGELKHWNGGSIMFRKDTEQLPEDQHITRN
ncbi:hypothetical protein FSARC_6590 [Fusarium sarcochroum]|uniref:N-acetyltransferase domain-containing protein n=1 Tax=Fusarium sarcochroum TaxID=1208366 RepID=A0A8H4TX56_9HYPO|nr:hypothetical protein FSARC_6590 [Fusarium sarcochroum]